LRAPIFTHFAIDGGLAAGFGRNRYPPFYVEAIVSVDNEPSKKVATAVLSQEPKQVTDSVSERVNDSETVQV
jgi:hypothetical protein